MQSTGYTERQGFDQQKLQLMIGFLNQIAKLCRNMPQDAWLN